MKLTMKRNQQDSRLGLIARSEESEKEDIVDTKFS
jgi:hypothetical protein